MKTNKSKSNTPELVLALTRDLDRFNLIFNSIYDGAMVTDRNGIITHFNHPYCKFLGINAESAIGKHCSEIVENSRMHIVAKTGKPEINRTQKIMGQEMIVQRIPIRKDGRIAAVYGQVIFKNIKDSKRLAAKLSLLESKVKLYEQEIMNLRSARYTLEGIIGVSTA
ncbi:MAG: PAS domain S-box protein, partial [Desulfosarcina sp.]|nr:PAS domain S-box protein [Desulfobacterales bacterium]